MYSELVGRRRAIAFHYCAVIGGDLHGELHHPILPDYAGQPGRGGTHQPGQRMGEQRDTGSIERHGQQRLSVHGLHGRSDGEHNSGESHGERTGNCYRELRPIRRSAGGSSWYNSAWSYQKAITISHTQVSGSSNLTNFPVLISLARMSSLAAQCAVQRQRHPVHGFERDQ